MKYYAPKPEKYIRVSIIQRGVKGSSRTIAIQDATHKVVMGVVKQSLIDLKVPALTGPTTEKTTIQVREYEGPKYGESINLTVRGKNSQEVYEILKNNFDKIINE